MMYFFGMANAVQKSQKTFGHKVSLHIRLDEISANFQPKDIRWRAIALGITFLY